MALRDPVAVYNAASNMEALFVRDALIEAGVEAFVIEDISQVGTWAGGLVSEIHKPQVWVERTDAVRAKPILDAFESRAAALREPSTGTGPIEVVCEDCGARSSFPEAQRGSVQQCKDCGAYVDVGEEPSEIEASEPDSEEPPVSTNG